MEALFISAVVITGALSFWAGRISAVPGEKEKSEFEQIMEKKYKTQEGLWEGVKRR